MEVTDEAVIIRSKKLLMICLYAVAVSLGPEFRCFALEFPGLTNRGPSGGVLVPTGQVVSANNYTIGLHRGVVKAGYGLFDLAEFGFALPQFIELLNARVYFWPGNSERLREYGMNHYKRYAHENPVLLRVSTQQLIEAPDNPSVEFCKYNSGSPRCSHGQRIPRGRATFASETTAGFSAGEVVEVTFAGRVHLPDTFEVGTIVEECWKPLHALE